MAIDYQLVVSDVERLIVLVAEEEINEINDNIIVLIITT